MPTFTEGFLAKMFFSNRLRCAAASSTRAELGGTHGNMKMMELMEL